jgi:polyisoprenyl-teichoic acid--peptidoglycan teichoic acid transferase
MATSLSKISKKYIGEARRFFYKMTPQKIMMGAFLVFLFICATGITLLYTGYRRISVRSSATPVASLPPAVDPEDLKHFHQNQPYALALLGYGGGGHQGGRLTDSIMVIYVQPKQQLITLISLPRDIWVPLETKEGSKNFYKINAAYAIGSDDRSYAQKPEKFKGEAGGGEMAKDAIKTVTGIPIQNFVALDFSGFIKSIDVLGGVDVKVEKTFDDNQYPIEGKEDDPCGKSPEELQVAIATMSAGQVEKNAVQIFPCRYEQLHFDKGITHMNGETALKYVRSRHSLQDGNDFGRAARQRNLLIAVKNRVLSLDFFPKIIPFISSLSYNLQTDLTLEDLQTFLRFKDELSGYKITNLALTTQNILLETRSADRQDVLMPRGGQEDWQSIHTWIQENIASSAAQLNEKNSSPSAQPTP